MDFSCLRIDPHNLSPKNLINLLLLIPGRVLHSNLFFTQIGHDRLCQHRSIISPVRLIGNHHDRSCAVPLPDSLRCGMSRRSVSKNDIEILCVVREFSLLHLHFHKLLPSHAADRANVNRRIKDCSTNKTFDKCSAALLLFRVLLFL